MMSSFEAPAGTIGKHTLARVGAEVDHDAAVVDRRSAFSIAGVDLLGGIGAQSDGAVGLGELHVVRHVGVR